MGQWPSLDPTNSILKHTHPNYPQQMSEKLRRRRASVPGGHEQAPVERSKAGQGHQEGDQGRHSLQGAVGKRLQVK